MATTKITSPELFDLGSLNTALKLPSGTTAERPTSPSTGEWRYNTTTNLVEFYDGGEWRDLQSEDIPPIPSENFSAVLYTGTGSTQSITGVGFQPDFVWIKNRDTTNWHLINDSSRGANNSIFTNSTQGNQINDANGYISSFDTDGFTVTSGNTVNGNGNNLVAWCWKANGGTTSSNTDGSITSTVQANTKAGFSIITWAGTGGVNTVGHGLNSAPELILIKGLSSAGDWQVYSSPTGNGNKLVINSFAAQSSTTRWNSTSPTSSVFTLNDSGLGTNLVAYAFQSVAQYSSIGTYTGNSSDNGPIVETGFEPAFLIIKNTSDVGSWFMYDNKRNTSNPRINYLLANATNVEASDMGGVDFLSNGFQIKDDHPDVNDTGDTYLYIAFAADPSAAPVLADSFNSVAYTGFGFSSYPVPVTGFGFSPSMIWFKERGPQGYDHGLYDHVRGIERLIYPDLTQAETDTVDRGVQSFDPDGVTLGDNNKANARWSTPNSFSTYVGWAWKANSAPTINTDGTIQSIVSANQASGFSIVSYTGDGNASSTVGHGLGTIPDITIFKTLSGTSEWNTYLTSNNTVGFLNNNTAFVSNNGGTNGSVDIANMSSTTFGFLNGSSSVNNQNGNGSRYIMYAFKSIDGFSKIGTYTGNGSATGPVITTGFQPDFVMIKSTSIAGAWMILDSARSPSNPRQLLLQPQSAAIEQNVGNAIDFNADNFQITDTNASRNQNGATYIYMAFKNNPEIIDIPSGEMAYMVIAGGGAGGNGQSGNGGGGGAGGFRTSYGTVSGGGASAESNLTLSAGTYTITVGSGATGGQGANSGVDSSISGNASITSTGGGGGGGRDQTGYHVALSGGSGGGGSANGEASGGVAIRPGGSGTANQGFTGASSVNYSNYVRAGGGGGAGSVAGQGSIPSNGGYSITSSISGKAIAYAGGGGTAGKSDNTESYRTPAGYALGGAGFANGSNTQAFAGAANTGSGGGGTHSTSAQRYGGNGGSGVVIFRLATSEYSGTTTGSPTVTTDGDYTVLTYTGSGTYVHS